MIRRHIRLFPIILWVLCSVQSAARADSLAAFNNSLHAGEVYATAKNDERPPDISEPHTDTNARKRLCSDLMGSEYFSELGISLIDTSRPAALRELLRRQNFEIFDLIYEGFSEEGDPQYSNRYHLRNFKVEDATSSRKYRSFISATEWVFVCLARKHLFTSTIVPYFVSREYDTGFVRENGSRVEIAARFIFEGTDKVQRVVMAEEPAIGYVNVDYNVEHYYIELKKNHSTAMRSQDDPLCRLVPKGRPYNRHARICASVLSSLYFTSGEIRHPRTKYHRYSCFRHPVSFQTEHRKQITSLTPLYQEWMIPCKAVVVPNTGNNHMITFYISRAYNSSQLFVYRIDHIKGDTQAYLENLSTRINFIDYYERN